MDIWALAAQRKAENEKKSIELRMDSSGKDSSSEAHEERRELRAVVDKVNKFFAPFFTFCKESVGKSTMVLRFLERNENPRPTIALEYAYGRRTRGTVKDLVHIWELGGGLSLTNLLQVPLTASSIVNTSMVVVLDLTKVVEIWKTFHEIIETAKQHIRRAMDEAKTRSHSVFERLGNRAERLSDHKDLQLMNPFPIPLVLVGARYDEFQNFEPELRKNVCKYLRYLAHFNGASLQMFSSRMENLVLRMRAQIAHLAFGAAGSKTVVTDHYKPLYIPSGKDSFEDIGPPPNINFSLLQGTSRSAHDLWQEAFNVQFPQPEEKEVQSKEESAIDPQYRDAQIDEQFEQKTRDLEAFIKRKRERKRLEDKLTN